VITPPLPTITPPNCLRLHPPPKWGKAWGYRITPHMGLAPWVDPERAPTYPGRSRTKPLCLGSHRGKPLERCRQSLTSKAWDAQRSLGRRWGLPMVSRDGPYALSSQRFRGRRCATRGHSDRCSDLPLGGCKRRRLGV